MKKRKVVILFFGSFNPIHIGHTSLALYAIDFINAEELWFIPTPQNPHKSKKSILDFDKRCEIINQSIALQPKFKLCDIEKHLPEKWYTYKTLRALNALFKDYNFFFLMGADSFFNINSWYKGKEIVENNNILVYPRSGVDLKNTNLLKNVMIMNNAPIMDISSTMIREKIKKGEDISHLLPNPKILDNLDLNLF